MSVAVGADRRVAEGGDEALKLLMSFALRGYISG